MFVVPLADLDNPQNIGYLLRKGEWEQKDGEDRFLNTSSDPNRVFLVEGEAKVRWNRPKVKTRLQHAFLDSSKRIQIHMPYGKDLSKVSVSQLWLQTPDKKKIPFSEIHIRGREIEASLASELSLKNKEICRFEVHCKGYLPALLVPRGILWHKSLDYSEPMGLSFENGIPVIRCFAPLAQKVDLELYVSMDGPQAQKLPMREIKTGLWEIHGSMDWLGKAYLFWVEGWDHPVSPRRVQDPYSKMHLGKTSPTLIFKEQPRLLAAPRIKKNELVIWEVHVRDFSIHSESKHRGKFLGLSDPMLLRHLKELGVNVIHLLPVQDFLHGSDKSGYDWGYMPHAFFCLEGWYASGTHDLSRIHEFREMVNQLHQAGFLVVMDVVFNHTAEAMPPHPPSSFQGLAPGYYYRRNHVGEWLNGSGCGNEFKSESPMGRRFILDCLKYFVTDFGIDGFRFDLMGLLDYETWRSISTEMTHLKPDILLYGEPWAAGEAGIQVVGKGGQRGLNISVFNDHFRDAVRGDNSSDGLGFIQAGYEKGKVLMGLLGSVEDFAEHPLESINYIACHDNYTLHDKILVSTRHQQLNQEQIFRMNALAAALLIFAPGIPFLHAGQEFSRTKGMNHNSYNADDSVNGLDWTAKFRNKKLFDLYKDLLHLRKRHSLFRPSTREEVFHHMSALNYHVVMPEGATGVMWNANGLLDGFRRAILIVHSASTPSQMSLPPGDFCLVASPEKVQLKLGNLKPSLATIKLAPIDFLLFAELNTES
ncbi:MAG: hypothetical protein H3C47_14875 [Candidatus Cloacimonetes bacterium]|nr:hypothetical protein [Candidatus Cloacimonadota bacterium]